MDLGYDIYSAISKAVDIGRINLQMPQEPLRMPYE